MSERVVRFKGEEFLLTEGGSITTRRDFEDFRESYAHLYEDGRILRYGTQIGTRDDLEDVGPYEGPGPSPAKFIENVFSDEAWPGYMRKLREKLED